MNRKLRHRLPALVLTCCMLLSAAVMAASEGMDNFVEVRQYTTGQFKDVNHTDWFEQYVGKGYSLGLIDGMSPNTFVPTENMTIAQTIKLAACLHSVYYNGEASFESNNVWYIPYVVYCLENGIITQTYDDYYKIATRAEFATIFANALPSEALPEIKFTPDGYIPDVNLSDSYGRQVYLLYRAGILTGSDSSGTFNPDSDILRSEMATIVARMSDGNLRQADPSESTDVESALHILEYMDDLRPFIVHGTVVTPSENVEAMSLNSQIKANGLVFISSGEDVYTDLGELALELAILTDGFVGKSVSYVTGEGFSQWNDIVSEYTELLATVIEVDG